MTTRSAAIIDKVVVKPPSTKGMEKRVKKGKRAWKERTWSGTCGAQRERV